MSKEEILLKEYETCQSHNNALGQQSWVSVSILITVNILILSQYVSQILLTNNPINDFAKLFFLIFLGILIISILVIFWLWYKRVTFLQWLNNDRMQDIEKSFGYRMPKNWRARGLDLKYSKNPNEFNRINPPLQAMINHLSLYYPKYKNQKQDEVFKNWYKSPSNKWFNAIFPLLILTWVIVISVSIFLIMKKWGCMAGRIIIASIPLLTYFTCLIYFSDNCIKEIIVTTFKRLKEAIDC
jgi:hypothetical protein